MQEIVSPLVEFVRKEMSLADARLALKSRGSSNSESIAGQLILRGLRAWTGQVFSNLRTEARREAIAQGVDTSLSASPADVLRASEVFATCLLKEIRMQVETVHANVQPNKLRLMASGANRSRAEAYFPAESAYRDFLVALDNKARAVIDEVHPGVSSTVPGPQIILAEPGEQGRFVDRRGFSHTLVTADAALASILQGHEEPLQMYSTERDALRAKIVAMGDTGGGTAFVSELRVPVVAYAFDTSGFPVREVSDLSIELGLLNESTRFNLQGWGDRAGDPVLDFARPLAVSPVVPEAPRESDLVIDHAGNRHVLVDGATAAAMVMAGQVPELRFAETAVMHDALRAMGGYHEERQGKQTLSVCSLPSIRYVVYDQSVHSAMWRDLSYIHHMGHVPAKQELLGWGDQPGEPIIETSALMGNSDSLFLRSYRAVFEGEGRGVLPDNEFLDIDHPLTMGLVRDLRKAHIFGVEVASATIELVRTPAEEDMNNVGVRVEVDFLGLQGYQEQGAQNVMRKAVDLQLFGTLSGRQGPQEGRVWVGRFGLKELVPIEAVRSKVVDLGVHKVEPALASVIEAGGLEP